MEIELKFLGTGTSQGVPVVACKCPTCTSRDPRDKRYRSSALVTMGKTRILIDAGPDFRSQMLENGIDHIDALLLTHNHKDHTGGMDDLRCFNYINNEVVDIYCEERVLQTIRNDYGYAFAEKMYPGSPIWNIKLIDERPFRIDARNSAGELVWLHDKGYFHKMPDGSLSEPKSSVSEASHENPNIIPIRGMHGQMPVLGYRFGDIAYITDMSHIEPGELEKLRGLEHLTLNTVGYRPHHSHFSLREAIELASRIGAKHTWLTHLSHSFPPHEAFCRELPEGILPAWDSLTIHGRL